MQRDPKHWLNTGFVRYYNALYSGREGFKNISYIVMDNLVPPYLERYAVGTKNDPLNKYPEILLFMKQQQGNINPNNAEIKQR